MYIYLLDGNRHLSTYGVIYKPNKENGIECYGDANLSYGWAKSDANNVENGM